MASRSVTGLVNSNSIVPTRRSSAQSRIPTHGTKKRYSHGCHIKKESGLAWPRSKKLPMVKVKKPVKKQKDDNENIGDRRRKISHQLSLGDGPDISQVSIHSGLTVSGRVMPRKTSSRRPSSVRSSSIFQPLAAATTFRTRSPFRASEAG